MTSNRTGDTRGHVLVAEPVARLAHVEGRRGGEDEARAEGRVHVIGAGIDESLGVLAIERIRVVRLVGQRKAVRQDPADRRLDLDADVVERQRARMVTRPNKVRREQIGEVAHVVRRDNGKLTLGDAYE